VLIMKATKLLSLFLLVVCMLFAGTTNAIPVNAAQEVKVILKDELTGDFISGVTFDFYEMDMITNTLITPAVGSATTNANGEASIFVSTMGRYVAVYNGGLNSAIYDIPDITSQEYAVDVTQDNTPGVQLTEKWAEEWSDFVFRDAFYDDGHIIVSGSYSGSVGAVIPASMMASGTPFTMGGSSGVVVKINAATGKCVWITQLPSWISYSVIRVGNHYYASAYANAFVNKIDVITGNLETAVSVPSMGTQRQFDLYPTSDGGFVVAGTGHVLVKVDSTGNEEWSTNLQAVILGESAGSETHFSIKSVISTSNANEFIIAGGLESNLDKGAYIARIDVSNPASPTVMWYQELAPSEAKARFNSVMEVVEGGTTYLVASGNIPGTGATYTIGAGDTVDSTAISLSTSSNAASTALIAKLDANTGEFVWAKTFGGNNTNNAAVEQEFNTVTLAQDPVGGYIVSGQAAGTIFVPAADNVLGTNLNVVTNDTNFSDGIIVRYTTDGKYVDNYQYGTAGVHDEYYGGIARTDWFYAVGSDTARNLVGLSVNLTSSPRLPGYRIMHYQMDLDGISYTLKDTVIYNGNAGSAAVVTSKAYTGFTYNASLTTFESHTNPATPTPLPIAADGTLIIELYYTRNSYTVQYDGNGFTGGTLPTDSATYLFGSTVTVSSNPLTRGGLIFSGWKAANVYQAGTPMVITEAVAATADPSNVITLTAQWRSATPESPATGVTAGAGLYLLLICGGLSLMALSLKKVKQD